MGLPPTDFRTHFGFRRPRLHVRALPRGLWSGLSLHHSVRKEVAFALGAARLVSTPSEPGVRPAPLGSGLPRKRLPRIWAVLRLRFPGAHSNFAQVRCVYQFRHARAPGGTRRPSPSKIARFRLGQRLKRRALACARFAAFGRHWRLTLAHNVDGRRIKTRLDVGSVILSIISTLVRQFFAI